MARPSSYTIETAAEICARIAEGRSIRTICKDEDMPDARTVFRWLGDESNEEFRQQYARACETRSHAFAEDIIEIADDGTEDPQRSKLRVDARKWLAAKMLPKKYGDKVSAEVTGKDGEPLTPPPSDNELARRVAYLLHTALKAKAEPG